MDITQQQPPQSVDLAAKDAKKQRGGGQQQDTVDSSRNNAEDGQKKGGVWSRYVLHSKIDQGTFSTVSLASLSRDQSLPLDKRRLFAIKNITPTSHPLRVEREIRCMEVMGGKCNVVGIVEGFMDQGSAKLVMNYFPHKPFHQFYATLTPGEVQHYLRELLVALRHVHRHGVIHRDIKPSNFLYNRENGGTCMLVDFGLAQETGTGELSLQIGCPGKAFQRQGGDPTKSCRRQEELSNSRPKDLVKSPGAGVGSVLRHRRSTTQSYRSPYSKDLIKTGANDTALDNQRIPASQCVCYGHAKVCTQCLVKREIIAPRAGTPGYRPPEVLLKYPDQTTAVDIWAVGIIFCSMLAKLYPVFSNKDDLHSLAEIISVFGYERLNETALALDRKLQVNPENMLCRAYNLRRFCQHFRGLYHRRNQEPPASGEADAGGLSPPPGQDEDNFACDNCCKPPDVCLCQERVAEVSTDCDEYGNDAYDLLERLLEINPHHRITAADALRHPYFQVQY
ncbi:probable serine/threonine-protein kinase cdc7 [Anopheles nili]|uniref:probable serine/threonine-protein kinase cdc7 n=1 Tax=Anopheles nili TaxID=185578 RepID=UPI00237C4553|nr:probable serine/threonine-protein kinase cdc7 [Anopheles nili]